MEKIDFYNEKMKKYKKIDNETEMRYKYAMKLAGITSKASLLDIGCKYAYLNYLLKKNDLQANYFGVDILEEVLKNNEDYDSEHFKAADASKEIPFPDNSFDYVFALEIIEHIDSPTILLNEVKRVLKKDGKFILSVPNPYCFWELLANQCWSG